MSTTKRDYQDAMQSQNACNASGIIHALDKVVDRIWEDARANGKGTDWVNQHPIVRLYVEQLVHLNRAGWIKDTEDSYSRAYQLVNDVISGKIDPVTLE